MRKEYKYIETNSEKLCQMRIKSRALLKEFEALDFNDSEKNSLFSRSCLEQ